MFNQIHNLKLSTLMPRYIVIMGFSFKFLWVMLGQKLSRLPSFS